MGGEECIGVISYFVRQRHLGESKIEDSGGVALLMEDDKGD